MDKTSMERWVEPEWLYELRYEKATDVGLDPTFNHALHLVTTHKHYETSPENINFIFCDDEDRQELWRRLYLLLPPVLMHALNVVEALFKTIEPSFEAAKPLTDLWLTAGMFLWADAMGEDEPDRPVTAALNEMLDEHRATGTAVNCPQCATPLDFSKENVLSFWDNGEVTCKKCRVVLPLYEPWHIDDDEAPKDDEKGEPGQDEDSK